MSDEPQSLQERHDELFGRLAQHVDNPALDASMRELAGAWRRRLEFVRERALAPLSLVFMAEVGCGKTTLIAAATGLRIESAGIENPKKWSVLPVDEGRTTLGDTLIEFGAREDIVLEVEPVERGALTTELRLFAADHWEKYRGSDANKKAGSLGGDAGEELYRLLRRWLAEEGEDPRAAVEALATAAEDFEAFQAELGRRVDLDARTQVMTRSYPLGDAGARALQADLKALMRGELEGAPAPARVRLTLPTGLFGPELARIVDTRGIDGGAPGTAIRARGDLQRHLFEPDTLVVVCSAFRAAPDLVSRELITALSRDELGRRQAFRVVLVHRLGADEDEGERVEELQTREEKLEQCRDQLRRAELRIADKHVIAVDARREAEPLRQAIAGFVSETRQERETTWGRTCAEAREAMEAFADVEFAALAREWDLRLWWSWDAGVAQISGLSMLLWPQHELALRGVAAGIRENVPNKHHGSQLRAATHRRGRYVRLDLALLGAESAAIKLAHIEFHGMSRVWLDSVPTRLTSSTRIDEHVVLRSGQFFSAVLSYLQSATNIWRRRLVAYFDSPESDELWRACTERWGQGEGYVNAVAECFIQEAKRTDLLPPDLPKLASIYAALPERPRLFELRRVTLHNFRAITHQGLTLDPHLTVLVGDNGEGKTTWLEAIAAGVSAMLPAMDSGEPARVIDGEVRRTKALIDGILDIQPQPPMRVDVTVSLQGHELEWSRARTKMSGEVETTGVGMEVIAEQIAQEIREHSERQLPLFAYYGTERLWPPDLEPREATEDNRFEGYRSCLDPASTHERVLTYVQHYTLAGLQRQQPFAQVEAICAAVVACVEGAAAFRWDLARKDFVLIMQDGEVQLFRQLSDGYRNIVGLVADLAWRAVRLNPQLGARAPAMAEGLVLIDEIDLHLHPRWQRRVLGDLRRVFPKLQFVTTTHSPFIIQSLAAGQLRNLAPEAADYDYAHASPEDITEHVMGVELPQRSHRRQREAEVAVAYFALLEELDGADDRRLAALERELAELTAPYSDNQAFVAQLRSEYLVAKAERPS